MATWVIGDVHGCWSTLERLLERIDWRADRDELWFVGDLVNRGPSSLEVLRWAWRHRNGLTVVLGNHDLHLLSRAAGVARERNEDTLDAILSAPDCDDLLAWMRTLPLMHHFGPFVLTHAGLMPDWTIEDATALAAAASERIAGPDSRDFLRLLVSRRKKSWSGALDGDQMAASAAAVLTRMRMVDGDGAAHLRYSGSPDDAPAGLRPWFELAAVRRQGYALLFGHWAMLGYFREHDVACLDSGCVYGGDLTALCLGDGRVVHQPVLDEVLAKN